MNKQEMLCSERARADGSTHRFASEMLRGDTEQNKYSEEFGCQRYIKLWQQMLIELDKLVPGEYVTLSVKLSHTVHLPFVKDTNYRLYQS